MKENHEFNLTNIQLAYLLGRNDQYEMGGVATHVYYEVQTELDIKKFEWALNEVIKSQPMLRAVINEKGTQNILSTVPYYTIEETDVSMYSKSQIEEYILREREKMSHHLFEIGRWPMFSFRCLKMTKSTNYVLFNLDMLIADGSSITILIKEILQCYHTKESPKSLENSFEQFVNLIITEKKSKRYHRDKIYWQDRVLEFSLSPELPYKNMNSLQPVFKRLAYIWSEEKWTKIKSISKFHNISPTIVVATAYNLVLSFWSNQEKFALNFTLSGRKKMKNDIDRVIGDFTLAMPIEVNLKEINKSDFWAAASLLKKSFYETYKHLTYDGMEVINLLAKQNNIINAPVLPIVYTSMLIENGMFDCIEDVGTTVYSLSQTPQVYLDCQVMELKGKLQVSWDYVKDKFENSIINTMFQQFSDIIENIVEESNNIEDILSITTTDSSIIHQYNNTKKDYNRLTLYELISPILKKYAHKIAVKDGTNMLTYQQLDILSDEIACRLQQQSISPGSYVGISAERSVETIVNIIGTIKRGAAYVPINPEHPIDRQRYILEHSNCKVLLTNSDINLTVSDKTKVYIPDILPAPDDIAYVIYTSGSTGNPKGVIITNDAVCNTILDINNRFSISNEDNIIGISSFCFDLSIYDIFGSFSTGARLVLERDPRDVHHIIDTVKKEDITIWNTVPAIMELYIDEMKNRNINLSNNYWNSDGDTIIEVDDLNEGLRVVMLSGDWIPTNLPDKIKSVYETAEIYSLGGATEASIWSIYYPIHKVDEKWSSIPYGYPLGNQTMYVLNLAGGLCPIGVIGEICIGGRGVAKGYLNDDIKTKAAFINHNYLGEIYRTGDYGVMTPEGYIEFKGRRDAQVKIRGHRIELGEIESVLADHEAIKNVVVVTQKNKNNLNYLCAYLVCDIMPVSQELTEWCSKKLPDYMIPLKFEKIDKIPLTSNGKVNKNLLPEPQLYEKRMLRTSETQEEQILLGIWSEVLNKTDISTEDNFFELGGDSIAMVRIASMIEDRMERKVALRDFLNNPTIRGLGVILLRSTMKNENSRLHRYIPCKETLYEDFPLTDVQMAYLLGANSSYEMGNVSAHAYYELETDLDIERFQYALNLVIAHQPMLRAVMTEGARQRFIEKVEYTIPIFDFREQKQEQKEFLDSLRKSLSHKKFSPYQWPLFDFTFVILDDHIQRLFIGFDLLIADGTSMRILVDELMKVYRGVLKELPDLDFSFRDYILAKEKYSQLNNFEKNKEYWKEKLPSLCPAPKITKENYNESDESTFQRLSLTVSAEEWNEIKALLKSKKITPSAYLCTLYSEVLAFWSNQMHHTLNVTIFNRYPFHKDVNDLIGDFTSVVLVDVELGNTGEIWKDAAKVQEALIESIEHSSYEGINVIREYAKCNDLGTTVAMPIVFTSMIFNDERFDSIEDFGKIVYSISQTPQVYLDCQVMEIKGDLSVTWDYAESMFDHSIIEKMFNQFTQLITGVAKYKNLSEILSISKGENELYTYYNSSNIDIPKSTLKKLLTSSFLMNTSKMAIKDCKISLTYEELNRLSDEVAVRLNEKGIGPGDFVGVKANRCVETIINIIGIVKNGSTYIPIDPHHPMERQNYIIENAGCKLMLYADELSKDYINKDTIDKCRYYRAEDSVLPENIAYVIYTSGSTGEPKGVVITNDAACNTIVDINSRFGICSEDIIIGISSFCFDLSVYDIFGSLSMGATLVLVEDARDIPNIIEIVKCEGITIWNTVPAVMELYVDELLRRRKSQNPDYWKETASTVIDLDDSEESLRIIMLSGDWIPTNLPDKIKTVCEDTKIYSLGGATEASIWSIYYPIEVVKENWTSIPYGYPLANQRLYILNPNLQLCPIGVIGEIFIGGRGVANGYLNDEKKTNAAFINHKDFGCIYATGDYGVMTKEGYIEFKGRQDAQVKIRGHRIELGEIESVLANHQNVDNVTVVIKKNQNNIDYLCAYIVSERMPETVELEVWCGKKLPEYMVPKVYVKIEEIPLTSNGKVNKKMLPDIHLMPEKTISEAKTETEKYVLQLWRKSLGLDNISIDDNFFEIGGDSIKAIEIYTSLQSSYSISLKDMFENQTIHKLSTMLDKLNINKSSIISELLSAYEVTKTNDLDITVNKKQYLNRMKNKLNKIDVSAINNYKKIILTGATGYLGSHLCHDLLEKTNADLLVIIRASDRDEAISRLKNMQLFYHNEDVYEKYAGRISVYCGDVSQIKLGITDAEYLDLLQADCIVNSVANVAHYDKYDRLYNANVLTVERLIELAKKAGNIDLYHISSSQVCSGIKSENSVEIFTEFDNVHNQEFDDYYSQTKYEAEQLLFEARKQGINATVFRVGNIVFNSKTGKFQKNIEENAFYNMLKVFFEINMIPDIHKSLFEFTFVDYVSESVVLAMKHEVCLNKTLHLVNQNKINTEEFVKGLHKLGLDTRILPYKEFLEHLNIFAAENLEKGYIQNVMANIHLFIWQKKTEVVFLSDKTDYIYKKLGYKWPKISDENIAQMYRYGTEIGYF